MGGKNPIGGVGPALLWVLWSQVAVATVLIVLRACVASKKNNQWRWDFIWSALAYVTALAAAGFVTKSVFVGLGNHIYNLDLNDDLQILRWNYYAIYIGVVSIAFSKFSVTSLMLEVQQGTQYKVGRILLWAISIIFTVTSLLEIFFTAFQCRPLDHVWDLTSPGTCPLEKEARAISYVHALSGGLTDVFLALYPITIAWNLQTSMRVKVGFCMLMMLGLIPAAASFVRFDLLHVIYSAKDFTYSEGLFDIAATTEVGTLIILGCVPPLRPFFLRLIYGVQKHTSKAYGSGYTPTGAGVRTGSHVGGGSVSGNQLREPSRAMSHADRILSECDEKDDGIKVQYAVNVSEESAV